MFAYNPTVNDNSGQYTAAGTLAMAKGITDGVNSATGAIAGGMGKADMDRKTLDMIMGKADYYKSTGQMDDKTYGEITRGSLSKSTGILAGFEATTLHNELEKQKYKNYANAQIQIKGANSGASGAGGGGRNTYFMHTPGAGFSAINGSPMAGGYSAGVDNSQ